MSEGFTSGIESETLSGPIAYPLADLSVVIYITRKNFLLKHLILFIIKKFKTKLDIYVRLVRLRSHANGHDIISAGSIPEGVTSTFLIYNKNHP